MLHVVSVSLVGHLKSAWLAISVSSNDLEWPWREGSNFSGGSQ